MDDIEKKNKYEIQWHPAFVVALQALLIDYSDDLEYRLEHPLTTGPLRIDILVIKKRPDAVIKRQIAEIFRQENIVEYKSPTDSLSVNEFHKAFARLHLYKALTDEVDVSDLTLSFVVTSRPRDLFRHLRTTLCFGIEERHPGVFVVTGGMIPIQIIDIRRLSDDENLWLRNLNRNLAGENLRSVLQLERKYGNHLDLGAYLYAILTANQEKLGKEEFLMLTAKTRKTLEEIGWGEQWRQEGRREGRLEGRREGRLEGRQEGHHAGKLEDAQALFAEGDSLEKISRVTGFPIKVLKKKLVH